MTQDWSLLQTFLRAAETGSLSEAARLLEVSQPTVTRQIQQLEEALDVTLFVRHSRGVTLTERGIELLSAAREVDRRVQGVFLRAAGLREAPQGDVRLSVNEPIGIFVLPRLLPALHARYPDIELEVVIDNRTSDLSRREADIALRMFKPTQLDLVHKHVAQVEIGMFASTAYVEARGMPQGLEGRVGHLFIGADRDPIFHSILPSVGMTVHDFALRTDNIALQVQAVLDGVGIGPAHRAIGRALGLVELPQLSFPPLPLYMVTHDELRRSAAVQAVFRALSEGLRDFYCAA